MLRILYVNSFYRPQIGGGAELTLESIVEGMASRGNSVAVLATTDGGSFIEEVVGAATVYRFDPGNVYWNFGAKRHPYWKRLLYHIRDMNNSRSYSAAKEAVERFKPDVVSFHNLAGISPSIWKVCKESGIPSIQVLHDLYLNCPSSLMFRKGAPCQSQCVACQLFRATVPKRSHAVDVLVGVSRFVLDKVCSTGAFSDSEKRVIYNARNLSVQSPREMGDGPIRFGYIGTIMPAKGVELLIREFSGLDGATLSIAGSGNEDYIDSLKAMAPSNQVRFLGHQESGQFYRNIDVLVVPSLWNDTLPGVAFEAAAFGVPVVASNRGGLPEIVKDGESGFIFDPDIPGDLRSKLELLAANKALIASMSAISAAVAAKFLDYSRMLDEHEELYRTLSGRSNARQHVIVK